MKTDGRQALQFLTGQPAAFGRMLGYTKLTDLHNRWIRDMLMGNGDRTLQGHRGSYKTTALGVALTLQMMLRGGENVMFIRKTGEDVKQVIGQVARNLEHPASQALYHAITGKRLNVSATQTAVTTSAYTGLSGMPQLMGMGTYGSITGKHADRIFTDDIVNKDDRKSRAERERIKAFYAELQNIRNPGGRIYNTGTPWHKDDAFGLMPSPLRFDCYHTGLLAAEQIDDLRQHMPPSLFAANYELIHIAAENALFVQAPRFTADASLLRDGIAHVDAAYGGEDFTAFTCGARRGDTLYLYGRMWRAHVDTVIDVILHEAGRLMCAPIYSENNADKGFFAREIKARGYRAGVYHEKDNKYFKISEYLRKWWGNIVWLKGTDPGYIAQIMDYNEDAEHDDAPDSCASVCRYFDRRKR